MSFWFSCRFCLKMATFLGLTLLTLLFSSPTQAEIFTSIGKFLNKVILFAIELTKTTVQWVNHWKVDFPKPWQYCGFVVLSQCSCFFELLVHPNTAACLQSGLWGECLANITFAIPFGDTNLAEITHWFFNDKHFKKYFQYAIKHTGNFLISLEMVSIETKLPKQLIFFLTSQWLNGQLNTAPLSSM